MLFEAWINITQRSHSARALDISRPDNGLRRSFPKRPICLK
jgi:hypothetical protein